MSTSFSNCFLAEFKRRGIGILRDDSGESSRAVLIAAAEQVNYEQLNEILHLTGGLLFVALSPARAGAFFLSSMSRPKTSYAELSGPSQGPTMYISVDAREGVSTGISVEDRLITVNILGETSPNPRKLVRPGHVFPTEASEGGVLVRNALPEGALDIVTISDFSDAALYIDLLDAQGQLLSIGDQTALAAASRIPLTTLSELIRYRLETEKLVYRAAEARLPSRLSGELRSYIYKSRLHAGEHLALVKGEIDPNQPILTRVQTEFTSADVFGGGLPPTRAHIQACLKAIGAEGRGVLLYLRRPAEGHLRAQLQSSGSGTGSEAPSRLREYGLGAQILYDLGIRKIELMTNSKADMIGLKAFGLEIVSQRSISPDNPAGTRNHG